jgi:hypothetical protein
MKKSSIPVAVLLLAALLAPASRAADPSSAKDTGTAGEGSGRREAPPAGAKTEQNALRISGDGPIGEYTIVTLTQPSRLVISIGHTVSNLRLEPLPADRLGIGSIQIEDAADSVRIILKAAQGGVLPYRIEENGGALQVFLTPPEQE